MKYKKTAIITTNAILLGSLLVSGVAFAETSPRAPQPEQPTATGVTGSVPAQRMGPRGGEGRMMGRFPGGVMGTVTGISGSSITLTNPNINKTNINNNRMEAAGAVEATTVTPVTYTIDGSHATVTKNGVAGTLASITVGDKIFVEGTVTGTTVVATKINDGIKNGPQGGGGRQGSDKRGGMMGNWNSPESTNTALVSKGVGLPIVGGTVTALSGQTITILNKSNVTYTIDATKAAVMHSDGVAASTFANIAIGDTVMVQGTVNGNTVVATTVYDAKTAAAESALAGTGVEHRQGLFSMIGGFFTHMFGF